MRDSTLAEHLHEVAKYPEGKYWQRHGRKVLKLPEPLPPRFVARFAVTAVEDPVTFAQIGAYVLRAAQQQEVDL